MSVTKTARFPDEVYEAFVEFCDRIGSNPNAEIVAAVRKHIGLPTLDERVDRMEIQITEISDRLKALESNAIATPQSSEHDI